MLSICSIANMHVFRIASHGYIVMDPWVILSNPVNNYQAEWLVGVQEWVEDNLEGKLHGDGEFSISSQ